MVGSPRIIGFLATNLLMMILIPLAVESLEETRVQTDLTNSAEVHEDSLVSPRVLHGKRERRLFRLENWVKSLKEDMKTVYQTYGMPSTRYREETMGRVVEKWTYLDKGLEFTFQDNKIIRQRKIGTSSY